MQSARSGRSGACQVSQALPVLRFILLQRVVPVVAAVAGLRFAVCPEFPAYLAPAWLRVALALLWRVRPSAPAVLLLSKFSAVLLQRSVLCAAVPSRVPCALPPRVVSTALARTSGISLRTPTCPPYLLHLSSARAFLAVAVTASRLELTVSCQSHAPVLFLTQPSKPRSSGL